MEKNQNINGFVATNCFDEAKIVNYFVDGEKMRFGKQYFPNINMH